MVKVISLLKHRKSKDPVSEEIKESEEAVSFEDIVNKNVENEERVRKERAEKNQAVLKAYKIKK